MFNLIEIATALCSSQWQSKVGTHETQSDLARFGGEC